MGTRWEQIAGTGSGDEYAARFAALAAEGKDLHGEATFCASLVPPGSRVLDAGCGTGRVGIRLATQGFDVVGVDVDGSMLAVARRTAPHLTWLHGDLADLPPGLTTLPHFDLVVLAGNVIPLLAEGTLESVVAGLAGVVAVDGLLVAGFGLDPAHLPRGCPVTALEEYDAACKAAGLVLRDRYPTWDGPESDLGDSVAGYAVSVHARRARGAP